MHACFSHCRQSEGTVLLRLEKYQFFRVVCPVSIRLAVRGYLGETLMIACLCVVGVSV